MGNQRLNMDNIRDPSIKILNLQAMGQTLKAVRKSNKVSMEDISRRTGIHVNTIRNIENGTRETSIQKYAVICSALGLVFNDIEVWGYPSYVKIRSEV